jgi:hypothetical protein
MQITKFSFYLCKFVLLPIYIIVGSNIQRCIVAPVVSLRRFHIGLHTVKLMCLSALEPGQDILKDVAGHSFVDHGHFHRCFWLLLLGLLGCSVKLRKFQKVSFGGIAS